MGRGSDDELSVTGYEDWRWMDVAANSEMTADSRREWEQNWKHDRGNSIGRLRSWQDLIGCRTPEVGWLQGVR